METILMGYEQKRLLKCCETASRLRSGAANYTSKCSK